MKTRSNLDNLQINCYNKSVEPRRLPQHINYIGSRGSPSNIREPFCCEQTAHFSFLLIRLSYSMITSAATLAIVPIVPMIPKIKVICITS